MLGLGLAGLLVGCTKGSDNNDTGDTGKMVGSGDGSVWSPDGEFSSGAYLYNISENISSVAFYDGLSSDSTSIGTTCDPGANESGYSGPDNIFSYHSGNHTLELLTSGVTEEDRDIAGCLFSGVQEGVYLFDLSDKGIREDLFIEGSYFHGDETFICQNGGGTLYDKITEQIEEGEKFIGVLRDEFGQDQQTGNNELAIDDELAIWHVSDQAWPGFQNNLDYPFYDKHLCHGY